MDIEKYNNVLVSNASYSIVKTRQKYYDSCKEVISSINDITTDKLIKEVTFPSLQSLFEEAKEKDQLQNINGLRSNMAYVAQNGYVGNIQSNGIDGNEKMREIVNTASELCDNFDVLQNMIMKKTLKK